MQIRIGNKQDESQVRDLVAYVRRRGLPTSEEITLDTPDGIRHTLDLLVGNGLLERFDAGPDAVWGIAIPVYFWVVSATVLLGLLVGLVLRRTPWSVAVLLVPAVAGIVAFGGSGASLHDGFGQRQWTPTGAPDSHYRRTLPQ